MSFFSTFLGTKNENSDKMRLLEASAYADAISGPKVQLVDVRTSVEYQRGHIKNALNIDFFKRTNFTKAFEKMDKSKPVYLYCRSGARSQKAARRLVDMGFSLIFDLKGGYMRWP